MTKNQIEWLSLQEAITHNRISEAQNQRTIAETAKHNRADENIRGETNIVNREHYERSDAINAAHYERSDAETQRTNRANEDIKRGELAESITSHRNSERINWANAAINQQNADINARNASTNAYNAAINARNADTNARNASTNAYNAETSRIATNSSVEKAKAEIERMGIQNVTDSINWDKARAEIAQIESQTLRNRWESELTKMKAEVERYNASQMVIDKWFSRATTITELLLELKRDNTSGLNALLGAFGRMAGPLSTLLGGAE